MWDNRPTMNKTIKTIASVFLFILASQNLWAQANLNYEEVLKFNRELKLKLLVTTTIQEAMIIDEHLHPNEIDYIESKEWTDFIQKEISALLTQEQLQEIQKDPNFWKKAGRAIGKTVIGFLRGFRSQSRLNGIDTGIVYLVGNSLEYLIPAALINIGLPALAPIGFFFPTGELLTTGYIFLKKMVKAQKLKKMYGGKENYRLFDSLETEIQARLHQRKSDTALIPLQLINGEYVGLATNSGFSLKKEFVTYSALRKFLKEVGRTDLVKELQGQGYSSLSKVVLLTNAIYAEKDDRLKKAFEERFKRTFVEFNELKGQGSLVSWGFKTINARNCSDLIQSVKEVPSLSSANAVARLYENAILPTMADEWKGLDFVTFNRLKKQMIKLRVAANLNVSSKWTATHRDLFVKGLSQACRHP